MWPSKCKVTPGPNPKQIGSPKAPVWCKGDPGSCVNGPKQIMVYHQLEGNNIDGDGNDLYGNPKTLGYNPDCGFADGMCYFDFPLPPPSLLLCM